MSKTYYYNDQALVADDEDVKVSVKFISDGNSGLTIINLANSNDPEIKNAGTVCIGKGKEFRENGITCFSSIDNMLPQEDEICIEYWINNELIRTHTNPKSEEKRANIVLKIGFPTP